MTILVAEDAPVDALLLRNIVVRAGHTPILLSSGDEALAALAEHAEVPSSWRTGACPA